MRLTTLLVFAATAGAAVAGLIACQGSDYEGSDYETALETTANLTARFEVATVHTGGRVIDFGTPEARGFLLSGWSEDKSHANGLGFVTSVGTSSTLRFPVPTLRDLPIKFRCRPLPSEATIDSVSLELNGTTVAVIPLQTGLRTYSTVLPSEHLLRGENRLTFHYGVDAAAVAGEPEDAETPGPPEPPESPEPKIKWIRLQLGQYSALTEAPIAHPDQQLVFLPYGTQVDFPVVLDADSTLVAARVDFVGGLNPAIEIDFHSDDGGILLQRIDSPRNELSVPLAPASAPGSGPQLTGPDVAYVSLRAESEGPWTEGPRTEGAGIYLRHPEVMSAGRAPRTQALETSEPAKRPNIVIYLVDTLRPDRISAYGYPRPTTPRLDAFAEAATLFEKGVGQSSWTRPSVASIFTGQWPGDHSIIKRGNALSKEATTLAELLRQAGYETAAFSTNPNVAREFGFGQGFDHFKLMLERALSTDANEAVFAWLEKTPSEKPFFLYVQPADPHTPYLPPEPFRSRLAGNADEMFERITASPSREIWEADREMLDQINALYDAEVAANDDSFGRLVDKLDERGLLEETVVIFISDHGEEFKEHGGWTHGRTLHAETLDFPLLIKLPGQRRGARVTEVVQHVDILPTIAEIVSLELPATIEGRSLLPYLESASKSGSSNRPFPARPAFSHVGLVRGTTVSIVVGEWKLIDRQGRDGRETELYRWTQDPAELEDLTGAFPLRTIAMRALIDEKLARDDQRLTADEAVLDPEIEARLRALGYL